MNNIYINTLDYSIINQNEKLWTVLLTCGRCYRLVSVATDGEKTYTSEDVGLFAYMHQADIGIGDKEICCLHDPPHALELLLGDAYKVYTYIIEKVHPVVKEVYKIFAMSPKQERALKKLMKELKCSSWHHMRHPNTCKCAACFPIYADTI